MANIAKFENLAYDITCLMDDVSLHLPYSLRKEWLNKKSFYHNINIVEYTESVYYFYLSLYDYDFDFLDFYFEEFNNIRQQFISYYDENLPKAKVDLLSLNKKRYTI